MALARRSVAALDLDIEPLAEARAGLSNLEETRAKRAGRAAAAEESLAAIERQRVAELDELRGRRWQLDAKAASITERLDTLSRRGAAALRRAGELEGAHRRAERRVALSERKLFWIRGPRMAKAVEETLRDRRAELEAIEREQAEVEAELDEVEPAIADLQATLKDIEDKFRALEREEENLELRTGERVEAIRAARRVEERAAEEADRAREERLRELGERLATDRPRELAAELARVEERELAIATHERRIFEYSELLRGLDRRALFRGALLLAGIPIAAASAAVLL